MNPLLLLAAGQGLTGLISGILGGSELHKANLLEKQNPRPTETIPQGVLDATAQARLMASIGMPAAEREQAMRDITRGETTALASARDKRSSIDVISTVNQAANDAVVNLNAKSAEMRQQAQFNLISTLQNLGQWQDKIWQWNSAQKFMENAAAIRALKGAGYANINTAMDAILSGAATATQAITGSKDAGGGGSATSGIDMNAITGGVAGNRDILNAGKPGSTDPTITDPQLFDNGVPSNYIDYLNRLRYIQSLAPAA